MALTQCKAAISALNLISFRTLPDLNLIGSKYSVFLTCLSAGVQTVMGRETFLVQLVDLAG